MRFTALLILILAAPDAAAGPLRDRMAARRQPATQYAPESYSSAGTVPGNAVDALDEVNAARGYPPFVRDDGLTAAAQACAQTRAMHLLAGHTANDFAALPAGSYAAAAGCGALDPSWGWAACCTFERHTYAGAAVVVGRDGRRFMHLFVR